MSLFFKFKNLFKKRPENDLFQESFSRNIPTTTTLVRRSSSSSSLSSIVHDALEYFEEEIQTNATSHLNLPESSNNIPTSQNNDSNNVESLPILAQKDIPTVSPNEFEIPELSQDSSNPVEIPLEKNTEPPPAIKEDKKSNSIKITTPENALPKIYLNILNALRYSNKKSITERILREPQFNEHILPKCLRWSFNAKDAGEKFLIYNYLQLVQDFVSSSFC
uniref:Uncharacterized protein n=1 Tax=Panagrolaimus sp. ES5 TaxID=591445 RepID=A0AC34FP79_9BILA